MSPRQSSASPASKPKGRTLREEAEWLERHYPTPETPTMGQTAVGDALRETSSILQAPTIAGQAVEQRGGSIPHALFQAVYGPLAQLGSDIAGRLEGSAEAIDPAASQPLRGAGAQLTGSLGAMGAHALPAAVTGGASMLATGPMSGMTQNYWRTLDATGDPETAITAGLGGAGIGYLEAAGLAGPLNRLDKLTGGGVAKKILHLGLDVAGEAAQEAVSAELSAKLFEALTDQDVDDWAEAASAAKGGAEVAAVFKSIFGVPLAGAKALRKLRPSAKINAAIERAASTPLKEPTLREAAEQLEAQQTLAAQEAQPAEPEATGMTRDEGRASDVSPAGANVMAPTGTQAPPASVQPGQETPVSEPGEVPALGSEPQGAVAPPASAASQPGVSTTPVSERTSGPVEEPPPAEPSKTTGIKNATVEKELEEMGLPPVEKSERKRDVDLHARAKEKMEQTKGEAGSDLLTELKATDRPVSDEDVALLTLEANKRIVAREKAEADYNADPSEANLAKVTKAQEAYSELADVVDKAGTKTARALRIRQMMVARDYSLAAMERKAQLAKGGKPLDAQEQRKVAELHKELAAAGKKYEEHIAGLEKRAAEAEKREAALHRQLDLEKAKREAAKGERRGVRQARIAKARQRKAALIAELKEHTKSHLFAGPDTETLTKLVQIAATDIEIGATKFAQWADEMVSHFGEKIRPHLRAAWDEAEKARDEELLTRYKARKRSDIAKLEESTARGEELPPKRRTPIERDREALRLKTEHEAVRRRYESFVERKRRQSQTKTQKALGIAKEFLDLPRAIISSFDVSAPGRQGMFFSFGHPIIAAKHAKRMFEALSSERKALEIDVELRNRTLAPFGEASGLELTRMGDDIGPHEEAIRSRLSDYIPGIKASNRAFTTFLNLQRAHIFDRLVGALDKPTLEEGRAIAKLVNVGSGRGDPGRFAAAMQGAGHILWSPKLLLSRFQLLAGQPFYGGNAKTRKLVAKEYARTLAGMAAAYTLVNLADAIDGEDDFSVEVDPRSTDFGKIRLGNTRVDILGGISQVATLVSRLASGETKRISTGEIASIRGDTKYGEDTGASIIGRFLRTKLTPVLGAAVDVLSGENVVGEKMTPGKTAESVAVPLSMRDIKEEMEDLGVPTAAALRVLALFGVGVQTYEQKKPKKKQR